MQEQTKNQEINAEVVKSSGSSFSVVSGGTIATTGAYITGGGLGTLLILIATNIDNNFWKTVFYFAAPTATLISSSLFNLFNEWWTKRTLLARKKAAHKTYERAKTLGLPEATLKKMRIKLENLEYLEFLLDAEHVKHSLEEQINNK